jgi:hypothetical protein
LHAENFDTLFGSLLNEAQVLFDVQPLDLLNRKIGRPSIRTLNQSAFDCAWHKASSTCAIQMENLITAKSLRAKSQTNEGEGL